MDQKGGIDVEYKSTIKSRPYFYKETKKAASLILKGVDIKTIKVKAVEDNIFQVDTETRMREIASIVTSRLKDVSPEVLTAIIEGSLETSKLMVVYIIMKTDRLFFEFINEVFKEKILLRESYLEDKDIAHFFETKKEQSDVVASWSDYTFKKIKQVYIRILFESGLIKAQKEPREIQIPLIEPAIREYLHSGSEQIYIRALEGEN